MIIRGKFIPNIFSIFIPVAAVTIFPFIFIRNGLSPRSEKQIINHEKIHIKQYQETFVFPFLIIYLYDFVKGYIKYRDFSIAYYFIRFEQEAYESDSDENYIKNRERFAWTKFEV
jgi:hypothetical protein